jgi:sensor histidine kinase YesM
VDIEIVKDKGHVTITQCVQHQTVIINICVKNMQHANTNKSTVMKHRKKTHTHTHTHVDKAVQSTYSHMIMPKQ